MSPDKSGDALDGPQGPAEVDRVDVELPPLPGPGGEGVAGARAIVEELASG